MALLHPGLVSMKKILLLALTVFTICSVNAQEEDAAQVFLPTLQEFDSLFFAKDNCDVVLHKAWGTFSGTAGDYATLERQYLDGAQTATTCAARRGYLTYLWIGEVERARKSSANRKVGLDVLLKEATVNFGKIPIAKMNVFLSTLSCGAHTPPISFGNRFSQVVTANCDSNLGPVKVDLQSMYVAVGGKDIWNSQRGEYLGRSLAKALNSRN
jgi:hypothetical protein